ncbi:MAG: recombination protein NinB [Bacteroidales bacterium]|nr:recombination protein NinB [Bacteroidales bacterium]
MTYDLSNPLHRKQFVKRCNNCLKNKSGLVTLIDKSKRTPSQNKYLHVIIRILAMETGVRESYAKDVYFKQLANPSLFITETEDAMTGMKVQRLRSSSELTKDEMQQAINNFRHWSEDNGYYLPNADEEAFKQAELETDRMSQYIDG